MRVLVIDHILLNELMFPLAAAQAHAHPQRPHVVVVAHCASHGTLLPLINFSQAVDGEVEHTTITHFLCVVVCRRTACYVAASTRIHVKGTVTVTDDGTLLCESMREDGQHMWARILLFGVGCKLIEKILNVLFEDLATFQLKFNQIVLYCRLSQLFVN